MNQRGIALLGLLAVIGSTATSWAEEPAEEAPAAAAPAPLGGVVPWLDGVDQTANMAKDWFGKYGVTLGMGIAASYQYGFNKPTSNKLSLRFLDKDHDRFSVDLAQITLKKDATNPGDWGFQIQGISGRYSRRYKSDWDGSGGFNDTEWERKELEAQQVYLAYNVPVGNGVQLKLGKFNTLVGSEVNEPWANPTFSRQLIYNFAQPTTHTGGLASYSFTDKIALTVGGINGWDVVEDNNGMPGFIGQLALLPSPEYNYYIGAIYGPEQAGNHKNERTLIDVVGVMKPIEGLAIYANLDYGVEEGADIKDGHTANFWGFATTFAYDLTPRLTVALRPEWFDDQDGARTGSNQGIWAVTTDLKFKLTDYMYVRGEYRHDESSRRAFTRKTTGLVPGQDTLAWELGYSF